MSNYGKYDPSNTANSSTLFVYKEVPVPSQKLNRWNGNLQAGFDLVHAVCRSLISQAQPCVLSDADANALQVVAASPNDMTVRVHPGWAVVPDAVAGITTETTLPPGGTVSAPVSQPRIDRVVLYASGALEILAGDEAASPVAPTTPPVALSLATIVHRVGSSSIGDTDSGTNSYIIDDRPERTVASAHRHNDDCSPAEACDGSRTTFSTGNAYRPGTLDVYLNGVLQERDLDYVPETDGITYRFLTAPSATSRIQHRYQPMYIQI